MAGNEYAVSTGGSLKLKGVFASGVKKKKKKKQPQPQQHSKAEHPPAAEASHDAAPSARPHAVSAEAAAASSKQSTSPRRTEDDDDDDDGQSAYVGKTEAEIRHEQMRKKRVSGSWENDRGMPEYGGQAS